MPAETGRPANWWTEDEERLARQKAAFVVQVWELAKQDGISRHQASCLIASRPELFPDLGRAGRGGASLLAGNCAYRNFRQWAAQLGTVEGSRRPDGENWAALLYRYRAPRPGSVYEREGDSRFWDMVAQLYETEHRLSLRMSYALAEMAWQKAGNPGEIPSYAQVHYFYLRHANQKAVILARHGEEHFRVRCASYIRREAPAVDECWVGDHHLLDCLCRVWSHEKNAWVPVRPWLTAWLDWGSLYFVGWRLRAISPNRDSIERALRDGIVANGGVPPGHLYIDNGKDYRACGFARPVDRKWELDRVSTVATSLGVRSHFAQPYNARAKVIEPMFRICTCTFSKLWPSYRGGSPDEKPEGAEVHWRNAEALPDVDQMAEAFRQWLAAVFHAMPRKGSILKGKSSFDARAGREQTRPALAADQIHRAFLRELPRPRKVLQGGAVQAIGRQYESEALWRIFDQRTEVRVKLDPDDLSTVWIYTMDGREIGPAREVRALPGIIDTSDAETIEELREATRLQRRQIREARDGIAGGRRGAPVESLFALPPHVDGDGAARPRRLSAAAAAAAAAAPAVKVDPDLMQDLDATIRERTADRLGSEADVGDMVAVLSEMERDRVPESIEDAI